jgi:hypothetical protein
MATRDEVYQAILRADQAGDGESVQTLAAYLNTMQGGIQPPPPEQQGAFTSGIASYLPNLQETYGGIKTLLGVGAERVLGEGDISKGLISSGAQSLKEANLAQAPLVTPERTSFTSALDKGAGSVLTEYLPYQAGSGVTSLLESLAVMGAGALVGSALPGVGTAAGAVTSLVEKELVKRGVKEATEAILKERGEEAAKEYAEQQAKMAAASVAAKVGATTALSGQAGFYGYGQTTNRAVEEAQKMGGSATDIELARVLPAGAVSTVAEFISDKISVGALKGMGTSSTSFITNIAKQILLTGTKEAPVEVIQQAAERYGANLSLTDAQAIKEYIDAAAGAYAMSVAPGGIGGARGTLQAKAEAKAKAEANEPVFTPVEPESTSVVPEVPPVVPAEQVLPLVEDITGVTKEAPPSAQESAETFDRLKVQLQQQAVDADAERIAEINRTQGRVSPTPPVSQIQERPSIAEAPPELTSQEDLLAKQAEVDARRLEAGMPTGTSSLTPGVQPTPPVVEEPQAVPEIVDNRPLTAGAAKNRLLVMSNMLANQGGDPASLTIVPHPSVANKFAIQSLDVPTKFTKELPATAIEREITPTIVDPVNAYVEVQRRTNTPAARRFVSDFEAGNITSEDVQTAIAAERKAAEPPLVVLPEGEIVSAPTNKTRAEPTSFQIDLKQKAEGREPFAITKFVQDGKNVYYASPEQTLEASQRTELALTQREQTTADAVQAMLDASTTQGERTASELALQSALRKATVRALADVKVNQFVPPEVTTENPPTEAPPEEKPPEEAPPGEKPPVALPESLKEFKDRLPSVRDGTEYRKANESGDFRQLVAALAAGSNPVIRRIGQMANGLGNRVRLDKPGRLKKATWAGQFSWGPSGESIKLRPDYAGNEAVNAHEMVHALTISVQRNPVTDKQRQYVAKIKDLYQHVKREFNKKGITAYGLQDEFEFTAEAMTNPEFQYELMQLPYPGKKSAWSQFVKTVADLLGITNTNVLTEIMTLVEKVSETKAPRKKTTGVFTIGAESEDTRKSLGAQRSKLGLYSELENKIQAGSPKAPAASWKAYINGLTQKGVKPEEIEWSGVRDWLDLQKGTVLKEDLTNYLKQGGVQVEETVLGKGSPDIETFLTINDLRVEPEGETHWFVESPTGSRLIPKSTAPTEDAAKAFAVRYFNGQIEERNRERRAKAQESKFGQYTLPGGENYREVLLTLPYQKGVVAPEIERIVSQLPNGVVSALPAESIDSFADSIASQYGVNNFQMRDGIRAARGAPAPNVASEYRSSHWKQPNVLAHIRLNDRIDADGKKVLFVEEIQSDWGQEGTQVRKKEVKRLMAQGMSKEEANQAVPQDFGFAGKPLAYTLKKSGSGWTINWANGRLDFVPGSEEDARREADAASSIIGKVPAAPFVTKTEGWLNLALKRIMVMASEEGYDRVAFANGEQNAERFSLDKQLSEIAYEPTGDGLYEITATDLKGKEVISEDEVGLDRIEELLGKEIAEKIARNEGDKDEGGYRDWRYLRGNNLKVEAKGMRTFYDTIVPTALKKLLPKVGGGQMQKIGFTADRSGGRYVRYEVGPGSVADRAVLGVTPNGERVVVQQSGDIEAKVKELNAQLSGLQQPGFDVTPEMQEKVATTGLPMFSKKGERTQQLQDFENTLRAQLKKFGLSDVGLKIEAGMNDAGSYAQQLIRIAADSAQPIRTLRHESVHALREMGFFTDAQWKSLSKMAKDQWIDQYLKQRNVDGKPLKSGEESRYDAYVREYKGDAEKITEEAVADAFADFDATKPPAGLVQAILKRLQNLFQSIQTALTNVESPEQIFGKVEKGELKAGAREADRLTDADIRKSLGGKKPSQPTAAERLRKAGQEAYQKRKPLDSGAFKGVPEDLFNKLGGVFAPRNNTVLDRIEGMKENFWQRVAQGVADQYRTIKEYSEDAYMKARMSKTIDGGLEGLMFHGHVFNDGGALNIRKNTKGLLEVLKPVGKELDRYLIWVALSRDSTMPEGKRSISDDLVSRRAELVQGTIDGQPRLEVYQKIQKEMNAINRSVLKVAVDAGLLNTTEGAIKDIRSNDKLTDKEKADQIAELIANPIGYEKFINDLNYIPFYKVMEDGDTQNVSTASGLTSQYFSKALKGGEKPFGDLMENTLRNWSHILSASMKNQAAVATIDAAINHGAAAPNLKVGFEMRDGLIYSTKSDKMVGDGSLRPEFTENEKGAVKVMMDGKPTYYKVTDPLLMDAIAAIGYMGPQSKFMDVAKDFKNILQYGVTISPAFKVNNLIRDSVSAMGVSELKKNPIANVIQGISLSDKNSETYIAALSGGAIFNFGSAYEGDQSRLIKRLVKQGAERDSILDTKQRIAKGLRYSWDKYNDWGNKSESANRLALYKQLRDGGMSHLEASFKARDLLDFSMQGSWPAFRFLTQTIPFLNARVQGLYKLGRDGIIPTYRVLYNTMTGEEITGSDKQKAQSFAVVATAVGLASAVLYLAFKDDEDFKKRDEWDRDNFWWIKLPGMDYALRIPKPFEIGAFGTLIERTLEQIFDSGAEGKQFTDSLFRTLSNTFALNPIPQMVKPVLDLYANKDSFTGAPIESAGLEKLSKQERRIDTTSPLAIAAGAVTTVLPDSMELSPVQVDYLIKGYFGWLGATASSISTAAVAPFKEGEYPDTRWMDKASLGLVKELPTNQSKYVTAFYESNKEISQAFADMRHYQSIGDTEKALEIFKEKGDLIALSKMYDKIATQMGKMRTQIKVVTNDPEMDGAAKAEAIDRMKIMIGQMAQQAEEIRKSMKP